MESSEEKLLDKEFQLKKHSLHHTFRRLLKRAQKRKENALQELNQCLAWESLYHEALLLQSNLFRIKKGMGEVTVLDWNLDKERTIILDPLLEPYIEIAKRFKQSKKLRAGIPYRQKLILQAEHDIATLNESLANLEAVKSLSDLAPFEHRLPKVKTKAVSSQTKILPYREFFSSKGVPIWVGRNAKGNETLTFRYGKGSDWWLHVRDFPGSHVLIKMKKGQTLDPDTLEDALQLALYFSKAKDQNSAEVCLTQCKYVARFGGKSGKVHISKHQVMFVKGNSLKLQEIKSRASTPSHLN